MTRAAVARAAGVAATYAAARYLAARLGLLLWALGGLVPLLQERRLPDVVRIASTIEILFQKVSLGLAEVWLLRRSRRRAGERPAGLLEGVAR